MTARFVPRLPEAPPVAALDRGTGTYRLRFEDLSQDGRILFETIVASLGASVWRPLLEKHPLTAALQADGVRPIFTRLVIVGSDARLSLADPLSAEGIYELACEPDAQGGVARMYLNMWTEIWGIGRAGTPGEGERLLAGRFFAEHVLTRPLAPLERRRVTEVPGVPRPKAEYRQPAREDLLALPEGATWLEPEARIDPSPAVFGLMHTDINQHVNSLVYPRLFEEAGLRRLRELGKDATLIGRSLEVSYRKPFFAGQAAKLRLRAFASGDGLGVAGVFEDASGDEAGGKPHAYVRIVLLH
jgi:hypothetical protein